MLDYSLLTQLLIYSARSNSELLSYSRLTTHKPTCSLLTKVDPEDVLEQEKQAASAAAAAATAPTAVGTWARVTPADCADRVVRLGPFASLAVGEIKELGELGLTDDVALDR